MSDTPERSLKDRAAYQWELFSLAMGFFSRLPMPKNTPYSEERMNRSGRYFSTVGLLLGVLCGGVFLLLDAALPSAIAIFLMMSFSLMLTGAFHEDGLTDMADGIGGGMTLERRLTIMKDSRIGTYGASALIMALLGKWVLLNELVSMGGLFIIIVTVSTWALVASSPSSKMMLLSHSVKQSISTTSSFLNDCSLAANSTGTSCSIHSSPRRSL